MRNNFLLSLVHRHCEPCALCRAWQSRKPHWIAKPCKERRARNDEAVGLWAGFTLLELLIALFIFTLVSVIMVASLRTVLNSQSVTAKSAHRLVELQKTLILMSRDFEQVIDRPVTNAKGMMETALVGTPRTVTFTHTGLFNPLGELERSTLQRAQYFLENENLVRQTWPVLDQTAKTQPDPRVLLDFATDLSFEYLDEKGKFQINWPPGDSRQSSLPKAVRVNLTLKNWGKISQLYLIPVQGVPLPGQGVPQPGQVVPPK